jgi:dipeptidyl aminopeptidase/acylaminoacyl peptidase
MEIQPPVVKDRLVDFGAPRLIASEVDRERAYCGSASWSADGRRIYFDASPGFGRFDKTFLQVMESIEAGVVRSSLGIGNCPTASPDGKLLAFRFNGGGDPQAKPGIYVTKEDGAIVHWLDHRGFPKWSPDGKHLLTITFANPCDLTVVDAATAETRPVRLEGHRIYSVPSWVDGNTIVAFIRSDKGFSIALIDVSKPEQATVKQTLWKRGDGTNIEPLYPVYSLAQKRGAFVGRDPNGQSLYSFEPGKVPRRLEPNRPLDPKIASLAQSPDGRYLLFSADRSVLWTGRPLADFLGLEATPCRVLGTRAAAVFSPEVRCVQESSGGVPRPQSPCGRLRRCLPSRVPAA